MSSSPWSYRGDRVAQAADVVDRLLAGMYPRFEDSWAELLGDTDSSGSYSDPFEHFAEAWDSIHYAMGETPLEQAVRLAEEHPLAMPDYPSARWAPPPIRLDLPPPSGRLFPLVGKTVRTPAGRGRLIAALPERAVVIAGGCYAAFLPGEVKPAG